MKFISEMELAQPKSAVLNLPYQDRDNEMGFMLIYKNLTLIYRSPMQVYDCESAGFFTFVAIIPNIY